MTPRIAILNPNDKALGFIDQTVPGAIQIYDSNLHLFLAGSAYTLKFKASVIDDPDAWLSAGNKLAFRYADKDYYLNIVVAERDEWEVEIEAYGLVFELLNEECDKFEADHAMTIVEYIQQWGAEMNVAPIVVNEVSDKKQKLSWSGRDTLLKRYYSLANSFECELEFNAKLNPDYSLKHIEVSIKKKIGQDRTSEVLRYGKEITGLSKSVDIKDIYTAIRPIGKDGMTLAGWSHAKESDGCYLRGTDILNPAARDQFPAFNTNIGEGYILKFRDCDVDSKEMLYGRALAELRKGSKPKVSFETEGKAVGSIGDTFTIEDDQYSPALYVEARVVEQEICFEDPSKCRNKYDNFTEVSSMLSSDILQTVQDMWNEQKVYQVSITASDGVIFKNGSGSTTLTAKVLEKGLDIVDQFDLKWLVNEDEKSTENDFEITADEINQKASVRVEIWKNGKIRGIAEVTLTDVSDGAKGDPGKDAQDVLLLSVVSSNGFLFKNEDINTVLTCEVYRGSQRLTDAQVTALGALNWYKNGESAHSASGKSLTVNESNSVSYEVVLETVEKPLTARLNVDLVRVDDGETGPVGPAGADGHDVTATVTKANGVATIQITDKDGTKTFTISDGEDGADGVAGPAGSDGQTSYTHFAWANSSDGTTDFSTTVSAGKTYMGVCTNFTQADPTTASSYKWTKIKGETGATGPKGDPGIQGPQGVPGQNGSSITKSSEKIEYVLSTSGSVKPTSGWSTNIPTLVPERYLWTRTTITWSDNSKTETISVGYLGKNGLDGAKGDKGDPGVQGIQGVPGQNGQDGAKGDKGDTGKGVSNVKPQYYLSSSKTSQSGSTWTYTYPSFNKAKYLFTRFEITWTDNSKTYTDAVVDEQWIKMSGMDDTITQQGNTIALKADQSTVSTLTGRVTANEGKITSLGNRITLEVNQLEGRMDTECDYSMVINQSDAGSGKIKLTASVFSKGKELSESQIIALGALNWFKSSSAPFASGKSVTVDVSDREFVHCKLEV